MNKQNFSRNELKIFFLIFILVLNCLNFGYDSTFILHTYASNSEDETAAVKPDAVSPPDIISDAAVLINADTMEILYGKNEHSKMFPASTTKMMSALLVAEGMNLSDIVVAPENYKTPDLDGSNIAVDQSESFSMEQLLNATLVASANDAIDVLAIAMSFSTENFVNLMNERAAQMGANNTHFVNPHGLHHPEHYTTARDLAVIAAKMMKNPILREIVGKENYIIPPTNKKKEERNYIKNTNWFIRDSGNTMEYKSAKIPIKDSNIIGVKTGYTEEAGYCLVSELEKDNRHYIAVVLRAPDRVQSYVDSKKLLYYGYENFKFQNIVSKDEPVTSVKIESLKTGELQLVASNRIAKSMPINFEKKDLKVDIELFEVDYNNIEQDMVLGKAKYYYDAVALGEVDLLASHQVKEVDFIGKLTTAFSSQSDFGFLVKNIVIPMIKFLIALFIWWIIILWMRRSKRRKSGINFRRYRR